MLSAMFRRELKGVVKLAVVEAGGQENCANVSGRIHRPAAFSDYANPAIDERHIPLDVAVELDAFNGNGRIIGAAARALGYVLVQLPEIAKAGSRLGRVTAQAMKECADVFAQLGTVLEDDRITRAEVVTVEREIDEAIVRLVRLKLQVRAEGLGEAE
jgi:hypothetical protein